MPYPLKKLYRLEYFQGERVLLRHRLRHRHRSGGSVPEPGEVPEPGFRPGGYFEGWYFKSAFADQAWSVIPGVSLAAGDPHCFVQVLGGPSSLSSCHRYPVGQFAFGSDTFEVQVGPNRFFLEGLHLELDGPLVELWIRDTVRWPSALFSPSSMGWYAYARFMDCYHGVIVLDAAVEGTVGDRRLSGGRFYLEKDWGSSFPRAWVWAQLASPVLGEMTGRIEETLGATLEVVLSEGQRTVFSGTGRWAGLEVVRAGELNEGEVALQ